MVSEVMLQQTQVSRVFTRYAEFIEAYPDIHSLSRAKTSDILRLWKGMGYNRRALYLKRASEAVTELHNGIFPRSEAELRKLPGIGTYTARAILVFAYREDIAMVDTNIRKIIIHFFFKGMQQSEKVIQSVADQLLPKCKSWEWHQALMDFGAANFARRSLGEGGSPRPPRIPFRESNRFYRGRIMDLLRERDYDYDNLCKELIKTFHKPKPFIEDRIDSLVKDGIARRKGKRISLPD